MRSGWARLVAATIASGCSPATIESSVGGTPDPACIASLTAAFEGRRYVANGGLNIIPEYGRYLGKAHIPPCNGGEGFEIDAYAIAGTRPTVAFASPRYEDVLFLHRSLASLPPELEELRSPPRCLGNDAPITLSGPWLGIIGPGGETEMDLVPPYALTMRVEEAIPDLYSATFLRVQVGPELGQPLDREDVRSVLWEGGTLSVTASCRDGTFWAETVDARPPNS